MPSGMPCGQAVVDDPGDTRPLLLGVPASSSISEATISTS